MKNLEVIILHGWAISAQNESKWQEIRDALSSDGIHTKFLALPGMDTELKEPWTLHDYVEWLASQLTENKKHILLGHSFGGQLAVRFAATYPDKVEKLILIASAGIKDYSAKAQLKRGVFFVLAKLGKLVSTHPFFRKVLYMLAREHDYEQAGPVMKKTMQLVTSDEIRDDIPKLTCPIQLVWGKLDTSTPYKNTQLFLDVLPLARLCSIATARHAPQFTHPQEVARCISTFILEK